MADIGGEADSQSESAEAEQDEKQDRARISGEQTGADRKIGRRQDEVTERPDQRRQARRQMPHRRATDAESRDPGNQGAARIERAMAEALLQIESEREQQCEISHAGGGEGGERPGDRWLSDEVETDQRRLAARRDAPLDDDEGRQRREARRQAEPYPQGPALRRA